jgi:hypothetical protein
VGAAKVTEITFRNRPTVTNKNDLQWHRTLVVEEREGAMASDTLHLLRSELLTCKDLDEETIE